MIDPPARAPAGPEITLQRRLANLRATLRAPALGPDERPPAGPGPAAAVAARSRRLATTVADLLGATVVISDAGSVVRLDVPSAVMPLDRARLAELPGQPPAGAPLVCLDTETTGLATAAGTVAFLVGLGWWIGDRFRQTHLLLPDHADERALLAEVSARIPPDAWLVTYNGRGFDWPLIETRFRMAGLDAPAHAGHLDLLPLVRRVFRHRLEDARLGSVEAGVLGAARGLDVAGWEIPAIYLDALQGGPVEPLAAVVRHNEHDVRSLARLLAHVTDRYGTRAARRGAPRGDLAGFARSYARERRHEEALECLDDALESPAPIRDPFGRTPLPAPVGPASAKPRPSWDDDAWWARGSRPDFGGRRPRGGWRGERGEGLGPAGPRVGAPVWDVGRAFTDERLAAERARLLRRLGRHAEAVEAWRVAAAAGGSLGVIAWIEIAKLREHRLDDPRGAMEATRAGWQAAERSRVLGRPLPRLEQDLIRRGTRLRARLDRREDDRPPGRQPPG